MDTLMSTYNDDEDDVANLDINPPVPNDDDGEHAESPPKKKQKSIPTPTVITLIHDVQPPQHQVQSAQPEEELTLPDQTLIHDVQPQQLEVQSAQPDELPEELTSPTTNFESPGRDRQNGGEETLIHDVQPQQLEVQPAQPEELAEELTWHTANGEKLGRDRQDDEEDGGEGALISDVQPQQLEVQSEEGKSISEDLPSSEQEQADELALTAPEETVTPSTAKSASKSSKKSKKKNINNVWTRPASRKGKKKAKSNQNNGNHTTPAAAEERVFISPVPKFPDKNDDNSELSICLSKFYKAEKVEISEDRLSAGSTKGYRMVRATRGVVEGAWYFEIKVMHLGETGHTRLGWSTEKGDLQAPVGFDANSFGYRDIDGSKVHKALRETYGAEGYGEGDVLGFYINLPDGSSFEPKPPRYVWFKGQRYVCAPDAKEDPPKVVPGSEICFFKNGICQGTAFTDLFGGRYYPAASMYTLPNQSNCLVRFNFGPDFDSFPGDFRGRPVPRPMIEVAYHGCDGRVENGNGSLWNSTRTSSMLKVTKEQGTLFVEASEIDMD